MALNEHTDVQTMTQLDDADYWQAVNALNHADTMVKVPVSARQLPALDTRLRQYERRYSVGGNIA
jgi:hypothetical protein